MSINGYSIATIDSFVGRELGVSDWVVVDQARIDAFAACTGDRQWIHIDVERAKRESPFGGTIAHGGFIPEPAGRTLLVNYGFDKIRFVAPVRVGKRVRALGTLAEISERKPGNLVMKIDVTVEIEGEDKPALIAEWLSLHVVG